MRDNSNVRFTRGAAFNCITIVVLVMVVWLDVRASGDHHDEDEILSCTISPNNGATAVGVPITLSAKVEHGDHIATASAQLRSNRRGPDPT